MKRGYYDFFVFNNDGLCVFSYALESDYNTNLLTGEYKDSGLGKAVKKVMQSNSVAFQDYEPYEPSDGEPAAFLAAPILRNGNRVGVVALQVSLEKVQDIVANRTGLGTTGESYLVGRDEDGKTSYRSIRIVKAGNKIGGRKEGEGVELALSGKSGIRG